MNRLRELRESRGLNMKEAAEALGYKYMTYVNYEKEARQLHSEQLQAIAHYFGNENGNKKDPPGGYPSGLYAGYLFW